MFNAKFIMFNAKCIIFNAKCIMFNAEFTCDPVIVPPTWPIRMTSKAIKKIVRLHLHYKTNHVFQWNGPHCSTENSTFPDRKEWFLSPPRNQRGECHSPAEVDNVPVHQSKPTHFSRRTVETPVGQQWKSITKRRTASRLSQPRSAPESARRSAWRSPVPYIVHHFQYKVHHF